MKLTLVLLLFSFQSFALTSRWIIPADRDVLVEVTRSGTEDVLYPFDFQALVWNIYKGDKKTFFSEFQKFSQDQDLFVLQEGFLTKRFLNFMESFPLYEYQFATAWIDGKRGRARTGVMTASRSKAIESLWQRSQYREPVTGTPKMTLFTKYKLAGTDEILLVGNIHAINFVATSKFKHMLNEAKKVMESHTGPILFGGDFNTHLNARYTYMLKVMQELGFKMVTFKEDHRLRVLGRYLDFVWVKGLNVLESRAPKSTGSDHNPMLVRLSLF